MKRYFKRSLLFVFLVWMGSILACSIGMTPRDMVSPNANTTAVPTGELYYNGFESGPINTRIEHSSKNSITITRKFKYKGKRAVRTLLDDQSQNQSSAHLVFNNGNVKNANLYYRFYFYIPDEFESIEWTRVDETKMQYWLTLAEWRVSDQSMISLFYSYREGIDWVGFEYGDTGKKATTDTFAVYRNTWHELMFHAIWSRDNSGLMEAWLDGLPMMPGTHNHRQIIEQNLFHGDELALWLGQNRNPNYYGKTIVFYDEFSVSRSNPIYRNND